MEPDKYQDLAPGEMIIAASSDYVLGPEGEPIKSHIASVRKVMGTNFNTKEPELKLALGFKLDESEAEGQVYTSWFTPSLDPKSNLAKMLQSVLGEIPRPLDPTVLAGQPLRVILENKDKDGITKQYVQSYLKPVSGQKHVEIDLQEAFNQATED